MIIFYFAIAIFGSYFIYMSSNYSYNVDTVKNSSAKKLMIVAHPDDELIWGGGHLLSDKYLVVCITCGSNEKRTKEFVKIMGEIKTEYVALGYPDLVDGEKSLWTEESSDITKDLKTIINEKEWEFVVTHNQTGEYGHIHHILTNKIVTDIVDNNKTKVDLYYFGKYYIRSDLEELEEKPNALSNSIYKKKMLALSNYTSQQKVLDLLNHMLKYEDWTKYN